MDYGILSLVPILITLAIVFAVKNVFLALLAGILSATVLIGAFTGNFLTGLESIATVFSDSSTAMTTFFVLMTGALLCVWSAAPAVWKDSSCTARKNGSWSSHRWLPN